MKMNLHQRPASSFSLYTSLLLLLILALVCSMSSGQSTSDGTILRVQFEYRMDVNTTGSLTGIPVGLQILRAAVENEMVEALDGTQAVQYVDFESQLDEAPCSTVFSSICGFVQSDLLLNVPNVKEHETANYAALEEVQDFITRFNEANDGRILVNYLGPNEVFSDILVRLVGVSRIMNDQEIEIFEQSLVEAFDGKVPGVRITGATVILQQLRSLNRRRRRLQREGATSTNYVTVRIRGECNGCRTDEASELINDVADIVVERDLEGILEENGENTEPPTTYFDDPDYAVVNGIQGETQGVSPSSVSSFEDPLEPQQFPWYIVWSVLGAVAIVSAGLAMALCLKRRKELKMADVDHDADQFQSRRLNQRDADVGVYLSEASTERRRVPLARQSMEDVSLDDTNIYTTGEDTGGAGHGHHVYDSGDDTNVYTSGSDTLYGQPGHATTYLRA